VSTEEKTHLQEMREEFGVLEAEAYQKLIAATAALVTVTTEYLLAEPDSDREKRAEVMAQEMIDVLLAKGGEKPGEIIRSLLALIVHLRLGGSIAEWFAQSEVEIRLLDDEPES
jgi:hypothetical protein